MDDLPTPHNGKPFYCKTCGLGYGEYMACEELDCELESAAEAFARTVLKRDGLNTIGGSFWKLTIPDDALKEGLEVGIRTDRRGLHIGDGLIPWSDIDAARARLSESAPEEKP